MGPTSASLEMDRIHQSLKQHDEILIPLLAQRSFHLPGNSWREDWVQWMRNNHIVFGLCFHHRLHPIETWERGIVLSASLSYSLVAANLGYVWDWDHYGAEEDAPGVAGFDTSAVAYRRSVPWAGDDDGRVLEITYGTLLLWTFGSALHSLFDIAVWRLSACACCHPGGRFAESRLAARCRDLGSYTLIPLVLGLAGLAVYSSHLRVTSEDAALEEEYGDDLVRTVTEGRLGAYSFLLRFGVELLLAWFVFSPLVSTVLLSGILGCNGRVPLLGGRPRDKRRVETQLGMSDSSYARF